MLDRYLRLSLGYMYLYVYIKTALYFNYLPMPYISRCSFINISSISRHTDIHLLILEFMAYFILTQSSLSSLPRFPYPSRQTPSFSKTTAPQ